MNQSTKDALDVQYVLNKVEVLTPYGKMFKNRMKPFYKGQEKELKYQLELLQSFIPFVENNSIRRDFNNFFSHVKDLRNTIKRATEDFILSEVELFEIKNFLFLLRDINEIINTYNIPIYKDTKIETIEILERFLDPENTGISTFYIYDAYSETLKMIRDKKRETDKLLRLNYKLIKEKIKADLDIDIRLDNSAIISKDDRLLMEKLKNYPYVIYVSETYINMKFSIKPTEHISRIERQLILLKEEEEREELRIRESLSAEIGARHREIYKNMLSIGRLDLIIAKAKYALEIKGIKPNVITEHKIVLEEGRHPKVEEHLRSKGLEFTPISIELNQGVSCITGANMGGKTISLKLIGLLSIIAHYGLYVPAKSMTLGLNKYIRSSIGDMQSTDSGLSTFGGEIKVVSEAIKNANEQGLILIDELARGTNPAEGYAISKAIAIYLKDKSSISLLTTHYDNVADIEGVQNLQVIGLSYLDFSEIEKELTESDGMSVINKHMDFRLRKVDKQTTVPKDALNIAKIMGLDEKILEIAEEIVNPKER